MQQEDQSMTESFLNRTDLIEQQWEEFRRKVIDKVDGPCLSVEQAKYCFYGGFQGARTVLCKALQSDDDTEWGPAFDALDSIRNELNAFLASLPRRSVHE
jgi:hypothetical protein